MARHILALTLVASAGCLQAASSTRQAGPVAAVARRVGPIFLGTRDNLAEGEAAYPDGYPVDETVRHEKAKGGGYRKGSPYYEKQEATREDLSVDSEPQDGEVDAIVTREKVQRKGDLPVSTMMQCIINLTCQYFIVYSMLVVLKAYNEAADLEEGSLFYKTLETTQKTVNYAPMLCVLFLATRMRAIQLTQGETEKHGLPQWWVQVAMQVCTWATLGQLIFVLAFPVFFDSVPFSDNDGNVLPPRNASSIALTIFLLIRYTLMALLYGGFVTVCIGVVLMEAPREVYPDGHPPVSVAVGCVMNLSLQYFAVYFLLAIFRTYNQVWGKGNDFVRTLQETLQLAAYTVNFAPMLGILFIGARMRALQMDPVNGNPQQWAQWCFLVCTYSLLAQTLLVVAVPVLFGGQARKGRSEGDITFKMSPASPMLEGILAVARFLALACLYGGYTLVLISILTIEHPKGPQYTPKVSPTMQCVMHLSLQFFGVYLVLMIVNQVNQVRRNRGNAEEEANSKLTERIELIQSTFAAARITVMLCPMLCILFLALRTRALQMTRNRGSPQGWAQDCMYLSTWAILLHLVLVLMIPCVSWRAPTSEGTCAKSKNGAGRVAYLCIEGARLIILLVVYGGAIGVIVAVFTMTPANANGSGRFFTLPQAAPTPTVPPMGNTPAAHH